MVHSLLRSHRLAALLASAALPATLVAQHVSGTVLDKSSSTPMAEVTISLIPVEARTTAVSVISDSAGEFGLTAAVPGTYRLQVRKAGAAPVLTYAFWMGPLTEHVPVLRLELAGRAQDSLVVSVRGLPTTDWTHDFYTRRRTTHGIFLTRVDLDSRATFQATDWLLGVRGVSVQSVSGRSRALARSAGRSCVMDIWVDNLPVLEGDVNQVLRGDDIAAVEIYPTANEAPIRYQSRTCGTVLVWSRAGRGDADVTERETNVVKAR